MTAQSGQKPSLDHAKWSKESGQKAPRAPAPARIRARAPPHTLGVGGRGLPPQDRSVSPEGGGGIGRAGAAATESYRGFGGLGGVGLGGLGVCVGGGGGGGLALAGGVFPARPEYSVAALLRGEWRFVRIPRSYGVDDIE